METICKQCGTSFITTPDDLAFYEKVSPVFAGKKELIPPPTLCPECRQQKRFAYRNERHLHRRICDATGASIIAAYPSKTTFPVFAADVWWSDSFDGVDYGRPLDFSRSFFDQLAELLMSVPHINLSNSNNENCEFVNYTNYSKDCYLIYGIHASEKCVHCWRVHNCHSCIDCAQLYDCRYCSDCIDCDGCYALHNGNNCQNCSDSVSLYNCRSCKDCLYCTNLVNQQFCIFNRKRTPEEFAREKIELQRNKENALRHYSALIDATPHKALYNVQCEHCTGDYLISCKDCLDCYSAKNCHDCTRLYLGEQTTDCMDCDITGWPAELCLEGISTCVEARMNLFSSLCWTCSDIAYCESCFHSSNLFGCTGLKKKRNCILNKQYTKEEYEALVPKIIEKMRADGEWGEFFPVSMSPFAYNETVAQEYFPMTKAEVVARGWKWRDQTDEMPKVDKILPAAQLPDSIDDIPDDILNWAIECDATKRPFKIIKQELEFYRTMKLPVPRFHPDERHRRRMALRNPRKLWDRECAKCGKPIATSYSPERPEIVYCEECYLAEVY